MSRLLRPSAVDAVFVVVLGTLALLGFHGTFLGWGYLVGGLAGLALGVAASAAVLHWRQPLILVVVLVVALFFVGGGPAALHGLGASRLAPTPGTWRQLAEAAVHGWKDLLTTLPPVDEPSLLVVPYLLGLVAGALGLVLAVRIRWAPAPVLVDVGLLAVVILFGVASPRRTALDAALFSVVAIGWLVVRSRRTRGLTASSSGRLVTRRLTAAALCLGAAVVGMVGSGHLPGATDQRVVLRTYVAPPFDVGQYPSPLAGYRRFTSGYAETKANHRDALYEQPLLEVTGLPVGTRLRFATLDSYNGVVWGAGNVAGAAGEQLDADAGDTFQKVSRVIDNPTTEGARLSGRITVLTDELGPSWVWLPTAGALSGISFEVPGQQDGMTEFRYNLATSTGVMPKGLPRGTTYTITAVQPDDELTTDTRLASGALPGAAGQTQFQRLATTWAGRADGTLAQVHAVASYLKRNGHRTDGEGEFQGFTAGHSVYRLTAFTTAAGQLAGDDEQFAAMLALMANSLGAPARVVLGAEVPEDRTVTGADVHAWVELQAADGTWKTLPGSDFLPTQKPQQQQQRPQQTVAASVIPPPAPVHPPATAGEALDDGLSHRADQAEKHRGLLHPPAFVVALVKYVVVPLLILVAIALMIVGIKAWRRSRRRTRGSPARRLAAGWRELLDQVRDFGAAAPARATRREQAAVLPVAELAASARVVDAAMFAQESPTDEAANGYWKQVDELRRTISRSHGRWARLRAAVNLSTLHAGITSGRGSAR